MDLGEEYEDMHKSDASFAFKSIYRDIKSVQSGLRCVSPKNNILNLVEVRDDNKDGIVFLVFNENWRNVVSSMTGISPNRSIYFALGKYVEMLREEVKAAA